jgi:hypothetical protein
MKSLLVLVLLAALGVGGFLSKPTIETHKAKAEAKFEEKRKGQLESGDLGGIIGGVLEGANRSEEYQDLVVASKYTVKSAGKVLIDCFGAFSQAFCSAPAGEEAK